MTIKKGNLVKITNNFHGHKFIIGEVVEITKELDELEKGIQGYRADNHLDFWFIYDNEIKKL